MYQILLYSILNVITFIYTNLIKSLFNKHSTFIKRITFVYEPRMCSLEVSVLPSVVK